MADDQGIIAQAERLWWNGDTQAALARLDQARELPGYFPDGEVLRAYVLRATGAAIEAETVAEAVVAADPSNLPAWEILAYAALARSGHLDPWMQDFAKVCPGFLQSARQAAALQRKGIRRALICALLLHHPTDGQEIARRAAEGGILAPGERDLTLLCLDFLQALAENLSHRAAPPDSWSLAVLGGKDPCRDRGGHLQVDLSWFRGAVLDEGWQENFVFCLAAALMALLPPATFRDIEAEQTSRPDISVSDLAPSILNILLLARVLMARGDDTDIRPAHRPMPCDPGSLVLRAGRVELWALTTWLRDRDAAMAAARRAAVQGLCCSIDGSLLQDESPFWPRLDPLANALRLMTNAGFHALPETAAASLDDWAQRYSGAILAGNLLVECAEDFQRVATLLPDLAGRPLHDWDDRRFLQILAGRKLVIATPYWREIQSLWDSGALAELWRAAGIATLPLGLRTVEAPMSVWPFRPDADWRSSFARLEWACQTAIAETGADVFLAACGCYGLPITHAMHARNPGLTAVYNGHLVHGWLGILTNDAMGQGLHRLAPQAPQWHRVNLAARFPGIERIDEGRYAWDGVPSADASVENHGPIRPEVQDLITHAEQLWWAGAPEDGLILLEKASVLPGFHPRGTVAQAYLTRALGQTAEAEALARKVIASHPHDLAAWEVVIFAAILRPDYLSEERREFSLLAPGFLDALRHDPALRKGCRRPFLVSLILLHPPDGMALLQRAIRSEILAADEAAFAEQCLGFLSGLERALQDRGGMPVSWSLAVLGSGNCCTEEDGHMRLDLAWFHDLPMKHRWIEDLIWALGAAIPRLLSPTRFQDIEARTISAPNLSRRDLEATILTIHILRQSLAAAGLRQDIRPAFQPMQLAPGTLYLRAGRVELWALTTWLLDRDAALAGATRAAERAATCRQTGEVFEDKMDDWGRLDPVANATLLATNAGWYAQPETAAACFEDWATRYRDALLAGNLLVECAEHFQRVATLMPALRARPLHDWDEPALLAGLQGRRVVIATPFWQEIQDHWDSGALRLLWRDAGLDLDLANLRTVPTPMSVWPHYPDRDWSASFARLKSDCLRTIRDTGADFFVASCGCYGLPITHAMHRAVPGLAALYNGHVIHGWFGVLTNDTIGRAMHALAPSSTRWIRVNLGHRFSGLSRIDDGRYVLDGPESLAP